MTISERIAVAGKVLGSRASLAGVIYEQRGNGEWRRSKDQGRASIAFTHAERLAERESRRVANAAALDVFLGSQVAAKHRVAPTPLTKERQKPSHGSVTRSPAALADFLRAVERRRRNAS